MNLDSLSPEYRAQVEAQIGDTRKQSKYRNQKRRVDNITFDSKAEARRYQELKALLNAGEITKLMIQPNFILQDAFVDEDGARVRAITYRADFSYTDKDGRQIVEDVKGYRTPDYKIKAKLFRFLYRHLRLVEIEA